MSFPSYCMDAPSGAVLSSYPEKQEDAMAYCVQKKTQKCYRNKQWFETIEQLIPEIKGNMDLKVFFNHLNP